jgi:hypothetical protein
LISNCAHSHPRRHTSAQQGVLGQRSLLQCHSRPQQHRSLHQTQNRALGHVRQDYYSTIQSNSRAQFKQRSDTVFTPSCCIPKDTVQCRVVTGNSNTDVCPGQHFSLPSALLAYHSELTAFGYVSNKRVPYRQTTATTYTQEAHD